MFEHSLFSGLWAAGSSSAILVGSGVIAQVGPFADSGTIERLGAAGVVVIAFGFMLKWFMERFDLQAKALADLHVAHTIDMKAVVAKNSGEFTQAINELRTDIKAWTAAQQAQAVATTELAVEIRTLKR